MHRDCGSRRLLPESRGCSGRALWEVHCGNGAECGSRPWSCEDHAGVLPAPAGGVVVAVGCTVFQMWRGGVPWALQARVLHIYVRQR